MEHSEKLCYLWCQGPLKRLKCVCMRYILMVSVSASVGDGQFTSVMRNWDQCWQGAQLWAYPGQNLFYTPKVKSKVKESEGTQSTHCYRHQRKSSSTDKVLSYTLGRGYLLIDRSRLVMSCSAIQFMDVLKDTIMLTFISLKIQRGSFFLNCFPNYC